MKPMVLLFLLILPISVCFAQTAAITQCEWFAGTDPGPGLGNPISFGSPNDTAGLSFAIGTGSMAPGYTSIKLRCRADSIRSGATGVWSTITNAFLIVSPATGSVRLATQFDYRVDNASWTTVNPSDAAQLGINEMIPTAGLGFGLHRLEIRLYDDLNRLGPITNGYFFTIDPSNPGQIRLITQYDYRIDNGSWSTVNVSDAAQININQLVSTAGLSFGLHRLDLRPSDDRSRIGAITNGYFFIVDPANPSVTRLVTRIQYWFNSDAPTTLDVADSPSVPFSQLLATAALPIGLNRFSIRAIDDLGRTGLITTANLVVTSPFGPGAPRIITAAEFFANVDPGPGNGVSIPLPVDGVFDESQEDVTTVITGLPIGLHLIGFRVRDDAGHWSAAVTDSVLVGPILVVQAVGDDIVLNWDSGPGVNIFRVYRAPSFGGTYALFDSTAAQTYTDVGAVPGANQRFYRVTFETSTVSSYRLPNLPPIRE
jgi:hypothetical protein